MTGGTMSGLERTTHKPIRWRRWVLRFAAISLAILALLGFPQLWGFLSPSGSVPILIGGKGRDGNLPSNARWFMVKARCIERLDHWLPPYSTVVLDGNCVLHDTAANPPNMLSFQTWGVIPRGNLIWKDEPKPTSRYERPMSEHALEGYAGLELWSEHNELLSKGRVPRFTVLERYISERSDTLLREVHCISARQLDGEEYRTYVGSCWGFGLYRDIRFRASFQLVPGMTERALSRALVAIIDGLLES